MNPLKKVLQKIKITEKEEFKNVLKVSMERILFLLFFLSIGGSLGSGTSMAFVSAL